MSCKLEQYLKCVNWFKQCVIIGFKCVGEKLIKIEVNIKEMWWYKKIFKILRGIG